VRYFEQFQIPAGEIVSLAGYDAGSKAGIVKAESEALLAAEQEQLKVLQYRLYSENKQSLLVCLQGPDASGKDGVIGHVFAGINPQGCRVQSFKQPSALERSHDFLWRVHPWTPQAGQITIFNRSHYEDVLVVRVNKLVEESVWRGRYTHINAFEQLLADRGTKVLKFFLHISKEEQLKRFEKRLSDPTRHWKISEADYTERERWDDYIVAFEEALSRCSTEQAPWFVIPSNHKWVRNLAVARILRECLEDLAPQLPEPTVDLKDIRKRFHKAKKEEQGENGK